MFDDKMTELVTIGASVAANCHPCVQFHVAKAVEIGVDKENIDEAISVGKMVRKGAAGKMDKLTSEILS